MQPIFAISVPYDTGASQLVDAFQNQIRESTSASNAWADTTFVDQLVVALLELSPAEALLPRVLRDDTVWPQGIRDQVVREVHEILTGRRVPHTVNYTQNRRPVTFRAVLSRVHQLADDEHIPFVSEWLFARVLSEIAHQELRSIGLMPDMLVSRLGRLLRMAPLTEAEAASVGASVTQTL